jgi:Bacterial mobilisation protein (MobC)
MASGSDKRQRSETVTVRLTKDERATLDALASRSGLTAGAFMRAAAFGDAGPRAQRRPPVDHVALRQLLGESGRVGNNLNQIARILNTGGSADIPELTAACAAYLDISAGILAALAMQPRERAPDHPGRGGP